MSDLKSYLSCLYLEPDQGTPARTSLAFRHGFGPAAAAGLAATALSASVRATKVATKARIVIIGAGAARTALANRLADRPKGAGIMLIEARADHLYQPGVTPVAEKPWESIR